MYTISQFSKITGLTVKALRYYDKEEILVPSFRNVDTQYRYYDDSDLMTANKIKVLRSFDFSIMEIKDVMAHVASDEDLLYVLQEKIKFIEEHISKEKALIKRMRESDVAILSQSKQQTYDIVEVCIPEMLVASIRFTGKYQELETYVPKLYQAVKQYRAGSHFNCYYDDACVEEADIDLCLPLTKQVQDTRITCKILPKIDALKTTHYGSYETLYLAYRSLFSYANAKGIKILTPSREVYIKGPGMIFKGNPAHYITEILLPFELCGKEEYEKHH